VGHELLLKLINIIGSPIVTSLCFKPIETLLRGHVIITALAEVLNQETLTEGKDFTIADLLLVQFLTVQYKAKQANLNRRSSVLKLPFESAVSGTIL
jgi:hypothetical protein